MSKRTEDPDPSDGAPPKGVQSVDRAISVLELLATEGDVGVSEVAAAIGVHKSTAFRLLYALEARDLVEQNDARGKYRLSHGVLRLAAAVPARREITTVGQPVCDDLAAELGETVNVAVILTDYSINVCQAFGPSAVGTQNWVGTPTALHAASSGKVLLANLPQRAELDRLLDGPELERFTPNTITDPAALRVELRRVAEVGHGYSFEELEIGLNAVAAPVRDHTGAVVAALSASGPVYRFTRDRAIEETPTVVRAAEKLSRLMGYRSPA